MARYGPAKNANLACLFVGRGRYHGGLLSRRSRARRDVIDLTENFSVKVALDAGEQRALAGHFASLQMHAPRSPRHTAAVYGTVRIAEAILSADEVRERENESR